MYLCLNASHGQTWVPVMSEFHGCATCGFTCQSWPKPVFIPLAKPCSYLCTPFSTTLPSSLPPQAVSATLVVTELLATDPFALWFYLCGSNLVPQVSQPYHTKSMGLSVLFIKKLHVNDKYIHVSLAHYHVQEFNIQRKIHVECILLIVIKYHSTRTSQH